MKFKNLYKRLFFRSKAQDLDYNEAMEIYNKQNAILIDVRSADEYEKKHIQGAINIPVYEIENIKNEIRYKDALILLYCSTGKRSNIAKEVLLQNGYKNVYTFNM